MCAKLTGHSAPGLFAPATGTAALFGWEALMTTVLGLTICGSGAFGSAAPVGIAAAVMAAIMAGKLWSAAASLKEGRVG